MVGRPVDTLYIDNKYGAIFLYIFIQAFHGLFPQRKSSLICPEEGVNKTRGICPTVIPIYGAF
jgi:hypothetical protein